MISKNKQILLVEDDVNFGTVLRDYLQLNGYKVVLARNGLEGFEKFKKNEFDICILDVMMPYKDGFTLAKEIRSKDKTTPIVFLTAKSMKEDVLKGYKIGADDYLTKPFDAEILLKKLEVLIQRAEKSVQKSKPKSRIVIGDFIFNPRLRTLTYKKDTPTNLSPKENQLLLMLVETQNDLLSRNKALEEIWNDDNYFTSRSMDVYIAKLRKYLRQDTSVEIANIHGEGFRLITS
ncbi:MAG: DNA-binding response regulator [Flavobacteriaceae bacterium TMED81]|jgi:DNA-binding response OmpR family regulator|nr:MAG: DNA-binding response regulator [Flavobacteriaceae bacterium TMED81]|tara:strand:- start:434 stop:1135 length:702 start_codon:yes stop_codon:yes gene_type:complete